MSTCWSRYHSSAANKMTTLDWRKRKFVWGLRGCKHGSNMVAMFTSLQPNKHSNIQITPSAVLWSQTTGWLADSQVVWSDNCPVCCAPVCLSVCLYDGGRMRPVEEWRSAGMRRVRAQPSPLILSRLISSSYIPATPGCTCSSRSAHSSLWEINK